jgi:oxygen-dependent protoporphyrinogen oxidase
VTTPRSDVLVVGAGITGLALATGLAARGVSVRVVEAAPLAGGNLRTKRVETDEGAWLLDLGPNSFGDAAQPFMDLVRAAGIEDRVVRSSGDGSRRWIWRGGRLREVPSHPVKFLFSGLLPPGGVLRLLKEPWVAARPRGAPEESLGAFCDRRLGRAAREKLLTPVVGGIYAGDPMRLGAESAFPAMVALEREHGSLIRAARRGKGPPSRGTLSSFAQGLAELPSALAQRLGPAVVTGAAAAQAARDDNAWRVTTTDGRAFEGWTLVVTTPADTTAALLRTTDAQVADELAAIEYAPMAVVHVGVRRDALAALPPGFGFLVPRGEGLRILGAIFSSELFPGRAPEGHVLVTVFTGGALDPAAVAMEPDALESFVRADLGRALGLSAAPALVHVTRWPRAIPQYVVGHKDRVARIDAALAAHPGLHLAGNWRGGIAMTECARNAAALADELARAVPGQ